MSTPEEIQDVEKREALEEVLRSATFGTRQPGSELPPLHLRDGVCRPWRGAARIPDRGRGARPTRGYSTDDDSSVRRRAYALRQKLDEVYAKELTGARIRIDVPKGSYVPRFTPVIAERSGNAGF